MKKALLLIAIVFCSIKAWAQPPYQLNYPNIYLNCDTCRIGKTPTSSILIPSNLYLKGLPKGNLSIRADGKVIHNDTLYANKISLDSLQATY